jgi:hypothetical protein
MKKIEKKIRKIGYQKMATVGADQRRKKSILNFHGVRTLIAKQ